MRCKKALRLMLLYREGELSSDRRTALTRHVESCAECAREAERIVPDFAPVDALRHVPPVLAEPSSLTLRIMRGIESADLSARIVVRPPYSVERFLRGMRLAGAAVASVLIIVYVSLSYNDARTLASLEERIGQQKRGSGSTAEELAREAVAQLEARNRRSPAEAGLRPTEVGRALQFLVSPHREPSPVTLEDVLRQKYPALASVTLQDGLDEKERAVLAHEGERFLMDLERLIRKEK